MCYCHMALVCKFVFYTCDFIHADHSGYFNSTSLVIVALTPKNLDRSVSFSVHFTLLPSTVDSQKKHKGQIRFPVPSSLNLSV